MAKVNNYAGYMPPATDPDPTAWLQVINSSTGKDVLKIDKDGNIHTSPDLSIGDSAVEFWQAVLDLIPDDNKMEIMETKINLIKAYSLLNTLREEGLLDGDKIKNEESRSFYYDVMEQLENTWK